MTDWITRAFTAEVDPEAQGGDRLYVMAPLGLRVVSVGSNGVTPVILGLVPIGAPLARHDFYIAPLGGAIRPLLGRKLGGIHPVELPGPQGMMRVILVEDHPWPVAQLVLAS